MPEPFAARLHFIPRSIRHLQTAIVRCFRRYFERAPGWVLVTTTGRTSGLPREVLLPCERSGDTLIVISTYGWRSNWIRNIRRDPRVHVTCAGWVIPAYAEIVEDLDTKRSVVSAHPFFVPAPFGVLNLLHRTLLRPLWVPFLRWWVTNRPVVVIRLHGAVPRPALVPELYVQDLARSVRFYVDLLGFTIEYERTEDGFAALSREGAHLMLEQTASRDTATDADFDRGHWRTGNFEYPLGRGINLEITIADVSTVYDRLLAHQQPIRLPMQEKWYRVDDRLQGVRQFLVMDPDGYLLRLAQRIGRRPVEPST